MKVVSIPLVELTPDPENLRKHPERNLDAIAASLQRFGQQKPIVVSRSGKIIAGNGTYLGAAQLGWKKIEAVRTRLSAADASDYAVADNRTGDLSGWEAALRGLIEEARADEERLASLGWTPAEADDFLGALTPAEPGADPEPPAISGVLVEIRCVSSEVYDARVAALVSDLEDAEGVSVSVS